ncbi:hypothetical protein ACIQGW_03815 [Lysinibacillus xylanilyticus]|uniref:hypothetical protein n=1 Tax=Lysinibacillus xylanilyticus TaxID=582475 RepID=UPI003807C478
MKILNEFCYQAIKEGVSDHKYVSAVMLIVDSDGMDNEKLISWELRYSDELDKPLEGIWIDWKPLVELNDEFRKYAHSLHGLEEQSKIDLATALYQEKLFSNKSKERISYRGMIMTYIGILEKELKIIIELDEVRNYLT